MDIDWIHRPSAPGATDGTLNLCFNALDRHVVHGHADEVALRVERLTTGRTEMTWARLLEEVAAFGGVLRAFGVGHGATVLSRLPMGTESLVAALASARVGAVHVLSEPSADPAAVLADRPPAVVLADGADVALAEALGATGPGTTVWTGTPPEGHDLEWDVLMRAGRTDPAPCAEVGAAEPAYVLGERVVTVVDALSDESAAWPFDAIATLVAGGMVLLSLP